MAKKEATLASAGKKKGKSEAELDQAPVEKSLDELILNFSVGKYTAIPLTALYAKELRRREENRHLTGNEILEMALHEVLTGKIDWKDLKKVAPAPVEAAASSNGDGKSKSK